MTGSRCTPVSGYRWRPICPRRISFRSRENGSIEHDFDLTHRAAPRGRHDHASNGDLMGGLEQVWHRHLASGGGSAMYISCIDNKTSSRTARIVDTWGW